MCGNHDCDSWSPPQRSEQKQRRDRLELAVLAWTIGFLIIAVLAAIVASAQEPARQPHYTVEIEVDVRDEKDLCRQAHNIALARFGVTIAELVTMTRGQFVTSKCLSVIYQTAELSDQIVSVGIYAKERE